MSAAVLPQRNFPSDAEWHMIMQTAAHVWRSGMASDYQLKSESAVILVMLKGWELGLGLMASLDHVRVIHGRVFPSAEALQALVLHKVQGARFRWLADGTSGRAEVVAIRPGHEPIQVAYTAEDAKRGGVFDKNATYSKWPANLLRAGAMRNACRLQYADIVLGLSGMEDAVEVEADAVQELPAMPAAPQIAATSPVTRPAMAEPKKAAALPAAKQTVVEAERVEEQADVVASSPANTVKVEPPKAREPGDDGDEETPPDYPLPFEDGRYAGKNLSDLSDEREFRMMLNGFRNAAKQAADRGDNERETDRLGWADLVIGWARFRGFDVK